MGGKHGLVHLAQIEIKRCVSRHCLIVERQALIKQRLGNSAIGQAGVQMRHAVVNGDAPGKGSLARGGWSINSDDEWSHCASLNSIFAPSPGIMSMNSGKDVAIMALSSTVTGFSDARPITRKLMAMR